MPSVQTLDCDAIQAMSWVKGQQSTVGYVNKITIAETELAANITSLWDPIAQENSMEVVGVMDYCGWQGGATQPIIMSFLVDNANQVAILNLLDGGLADTVLHVEFTVYNFDPTPVPPSYYNFDPTAAPSDYYPTFWTGGNAIQGLVAKQGSLLGLSVETEHDQRFSSPFLYRCALEITPLPNMQQTLHMAYSRSTKYVSSFGTI